MKAIEVEDLKKTYPRGVEALRGVSFTIEPGEIFGLLGPNGAGKSTTVKILATLSTPTAGQARVGGLDVVSEGAEVRRKIGYVAQVSGVDPLSTARENLLLQGRFFRLTGSRLKERVDELLTFFDLGAAADRIVRTFSGGMKRRLDVAMGLIHRPEVLFLDEPTTGLDPQSRSVMWKEVRRLAREDGIAILLTTHYLEEADKLAARLAIIDAGKVVAAGTPEELKGRLSGDLVAVELTDREDLPRAREVLGGLEGVSDPLIDGATLFARVDKGARSVPGIVAALEKADLPLAQIALSRPSLDEVYLAATGHAYHQEVA